MKSSNKTTQTCMQMFHFMFQNNVVTYDKNDKILSHTFGNIFKSVNIFLQQTR